MNVLSIKRTVAAAIVLGGLIGSASAQDPAPSAASPPGATGRDQSPVAQPVSAATRLDSAAKILGDIPDRELKTEGKELFGQLKQHFTEMVALNSEAQVKAADNKVIERPVPSTAPVGTSGTKSEAERGDWKDKFSTVERDLTALIGGGPSTGGPAVQPVPGAGVRDLPEDVKKQLSDFRIQLELFYAASMGQSMSKKENCRSDDSWFNARANGRRARA